MKLYEAKNLIKKLLDQKQIERLWLLKKSSQKFIPAC